MPEDKAKLNDLAWDKVNDEIGLVDHVNAHGHYVISAVDLKRLSGGREPRLLVKFDSNAQRPRLFKQFKLNILPVSRSNYVVYRDYQNVSFKKLLPIYEQRTVTPHPPVVDLGQFETLRVSGCTCESEVIDLALLSSMLSTFCGTDGLHRTKNGRRRAGEFQIKLPDCAATIQVENAQVEIDSVAESPNVVALIEAKMGFQDDFNIRQLYYPYQSLRLQTSKRIVPILLCYSNDEFQFNEFRIGQEFGDIELVRQQYFVLDEYVVARGDLANLVIRQQPIEMYDITFPQADDMDKVVDVVRMAAREPINYAKTAEFFGFTERQSRYYTSAAHYLGLLNKDRTISASGSKFLEHKYRINRTEFLLKRMLDRPALRDAILLMEKRNFDLNLVTTKEIAHLINLHRNNEYSQETVERRAQCVRNWLKWLVANCDFVRCSLEI